ncbi:hypothetical protein BKA69DRAFT_1091213 [Paraphysoderma sedebokerense]|nr:hypothetical protein BKA69DRAFT_1091213 [Paraphysoderma sedebokerense]
MSIETIVMDEEGVLSRLTLDNPNSYPSNMTFYPLGFLENPAGEIRSSSQFLKRLRIPFQSFLKIADTSEGMNLVPTFQPNSRSRFHAIRNNGTIHYNGIPASHRNFKLVSNHGGEGIVTAISPDGTFMDVINLQTFKADSKSENISRYNDLAVSTFTSTLISYFSTTTPPLESVNVTISPASTYAFTKADMYKTIVANSGSIFLTAITSTTTAQGVIVVPPTSNSASAGTWSIHDLKPFIQTSLGINQTVDIVNAGGVNNRVYNVSITAGGYKFTTDHIDNYFYANPYAGIITHLISDSAVSV